MFKWSGDLKASLAGSKRVSLHKKNLYSGIATLLQESYTRMFQRIQVSDSLAPIIGKVVNQE